MLYILVIGLLDWIFFKRERGPETSICSIQITSQICHLLNTWVLENHEICKNEFK